MVNSSDIQKSDLYSEVAHDKNHLEAVPKNQVFPLKIGFNSGYNIKSTGSLKVKYLRNGSTDLHEILHCLHVCVHGSLCVKKKLVVTKYLMSLSLGKVF